MGGILETVYNFVNSQLLIDMATMEKAADTVMTVTNAVSRITDAWFPKDVYVPTLLKTGASMIGDAFESSSYSVKHIDLTDVTFWQAAIIILIHPVLWNVLGRFEYYTRAISRVFVKPVIGVYLLALWIFLAGLYRDALFVIAMKTQPKLDQLDSPLFTATAAAAMLVGAVLVLTSFFQLGMCGTYLGDYFGILMEKRVTAFPFNVVDDPMYDGSTLIFLGKAIL